MNLAPKIVTGLSHPFVSSAYIREDFAKGSQKPIKVLVINSVPRATDATGSKEKDGLYADFLSKMDILFDKVQKKGTNFDRVDIRLH